MNGNCARQDIGRPILGGCNGYTDWPLGYDDDTGQYPDVEDAFLSVGCTGGHDVCSNNCQFEQEFPVQPPEPSVQIFESDDCLEGGGQSDGEISWNEFNEVTSESNECQSGCWNDINSEQDAGSSSSYMWYCNCDFEASSAALPGKENQ